jgi:hypothetical protein
VEKTIYELVLDFMREHRSQQFTTQEIGDAIGKPRHSVARPVLKLVQEKLLNQTVKPSFGHYGQPAKYMAAAWVPIVETVAQAKAQQNGAVLREHVAEEPAEMTATSSSKKLVVLLRQAIDVLEEAIEHAESQDRRNGDIAAALALVAEATAPRRKK